LSSGRAEGRPSSLRGAAAPAPLAPFADALPLPPRRLAREHQGWLRVRLRTGSHRFHRDLPESRVWTYDGSVPGPTIEAERGHPVRVDWRNELEGTLPVAVPPQGLVLASAERADLLVDFSDLPPGNELELVNTATAPFDGAPFPAERARQAANLDGLLPYPHVMRFRVVPGPGRLTRRSAGRRLATDYTRPTDRELAGAVRRAVVLVEQELDDAPNMLTMRELAPAPDDSGEPLLTVVDQGADGHAETVARYRTVASHFEDTVTFFPMLGKWELWRLINLTADTHPVHIHLNAFHVLARRPITVTVPQGGITDTGTTARVRLGRSPEDGREHVVDANELGLKDTVRVNPNEIVELAVRFEGFSGRYMYHCHILEHEDRDMMRPIVVMPEELGPFMS
jgi:FtsP/CotA-like multicopper oxidase with cupredoxin domain